MKEVDKLIENYAKKLNENIQKGKDIASMASDITALATLISARAVAGDSLLNI